MTDQLTLFPYGGQAPAQRHSATSKAAAEKITPRLGPLQKAVLALLHRHPEGLTDEEITTALGSPYIGPSTLRPRRIELTKMGRIKDSGRTRPGKSGRHMTVWVIG